MPLPNIPTLTHADVVRAVIRRHHRGWTVLLFTSVVLSAVVGVPLYGFLYHYTWLDWSLFGLLYLISGF